MCFFACNIGKAFLDGIYDFFFSKTNKDDNKIFPPNQVKDAFKFMYDDSEIFWCEWWTIYFHGKKDDKICGMINYIFVKGLNQIGKCIIYPALCVDGNKFNSWDTYSLDSFNINNEKVSIDKHSINKISEEKYSFIGESSNQIKWDLCIEKKKYDSLNVAQKIKIGFDTPINIPISQNLSFLSILPLGNVTGSISINGIDHDIELVGEMEHLWGPAILPTLNWNLLFGSDDNDNIIYWLHAPNTSTSEERGCIHLNLNNKKYYIRDYDVNEYKSNNRYPDRVLITALYENITIEYNNLSISASNDDSASENHSAIKINCDDKEYILYGMAEYHRTSDKKKIEINYH